MRAYLFLFIFLLNTLNLVAQRDSIYLNADLMNDQDIEKNDGNNNVNEQRVAVLNRFAENTDKAFQPTYIITKEEIRRLGHSSLIDVLRMLPGIQVSPSGSGLMGEHFSLHGLLGNRYMKILIDDVPIKPISALGMPLGYQLPIKQAERIEIIYGAQLQYGEDACAGVINIVTKESERPVNTTADIKFGSQRYNEINVFFGGKFGKDKRIVKFDIYGNYTYSDDRNIFNGNDSLFLLKNYMFDDGKKLLTDITKHPNLQNQGIYSKESFVGKLPFESRAFGIKMKYKGLNINFDNLYRRDHSALGFNTRAIFYGNTSDYIAENITRVALSWTKKKKRVVRNSSLYAISYRMDPYSAVTYLQPTIYKELIQAEFEQKPSFFWTKKVQDDMNKMYLDTFFTGKRYQNFVSNELGFQRFSKRTFLSKKVVLTMGLSVNLSERILYVNYNNFPADGIPVLGYGFKENSTSNYSKIKPLQSITTDIGFTFSQWSKLSYCGKKLRTSLAYMANANSVTVVNYIYDFNMPFSMEASYKITPKLKISASRAKTVAMFPVYMADNNIGFKAQSKISSFNSKFSDLYYLGNERNNEKYENMNFGVSYSREKIFRGKPRSIYWTSNIFYQNIHDLALPEISRPENDFFNATAFYYKNFAGYKITRYGIEISRISKGSKGGYRDVSLSISDFKTTIPNFKNDYPSIMLKSRNSLVAYKKIQGVIDIILLTEPQNIYAKNKLNLKYNYQLMLNYLINSNLKANIKLTANNIRTGISAPFLQNDLLQYNPQNNTGQIFIGLNYSLE